MWKVAAHHDPFGPPDWLATFDSNTPTELVTAFTSALATSYAEDPDTVLTGPRRPAEEGFRPLEGAGWKRGSWRLTTLFTAPDGLAGLAYRGGILDRHAELRGDQDRWLLWGGQDGYSSRWYATFTSAVPVDLIAATTARLADPSPALRYEVEIPQRNRSAARTRPVPPPVPTPLDVRRATAARARSHGGHSSAAHRRHPQPRAPSVPSRRPAPPTNGGPRRGARKRQPAPTASPAYWHRRPRREWRPLATAEPERLGVPTGAEDGRAAAPCTTSPAASRAAVGSRRPHDAPGDVAPASADRLRHRLDGQVDPSAVRHAGSTHGRCYRVVHGLVVRTHLLIQHAALPAFQRSPRKQLPGRPIHSPE